VHDEDLLRHYQCFHTVQHALILFTFYDAVYNGSYETYCRKTFRRFLLSTYTSQTLSFSMAYYMPPFSTSYREVFWEEMTTTFRGTVIDLAFHWIS